MRSISVILSATLTMFSLLLSANFAKAIEPVFFHQAKGQSIEISPTLLSVDHSYKIKGSSTTLKINGLLTNIKGEYGISENYSTGLILGYGNYEMTYPGAPNQNSSGLGDPELFFYGNNGIGNGTLRYGASLFLPLEKSKVEGNNSNLATGGTKLQPYVGYDVALGSFLLGGKGSYDLLKTETEAEITSGGTKTTIKGTGGETLTMTVFGEMPLSSALLGLAVGYSSTAKTKTKTATTTTENADARTAYGAAVYGTILWENARLTPTLSYQTVTWEQTSTIENNSVTSLSLLANFVF